MKPTCMYPQQKSYRCDETLITTPKIERIKKKKEKKTRLRW